MNESTPLTVMGYLFAVVIGAAIWEETESLLLIGVWVAICFFFWFFQCGCGEVCGIPIITPSRCDRLLEYFRKKTPEEIEQEVESRKRVESIFNELKEKGCIAQDRELDVNGLPRKKRFTR